MPADKQAARELEIFIDNDADLYRQQTTSILKNLATKMVKGMYDKKKAVKLWMYLVDNGAKKYARMYSSSASEWNTIFTKPTREAVATSLNESFLAEYALGAYSSMLPKKYQHLGPR